MQCTNNITDSLGRELDGILLLLLLLIL